MKNLRSNSRLPIFLLVFAMFVLSSCDSSFYLTEKEFYALRGTVINQTAAGQTFGGMQGQTLQMTFDNSVSPPRLQTSNLRDLMRNHMPTIAILEGYPSNALQIDRVAGEIEGQLDNWLAGQMRLYAGANNAQARLERVEAVRIQFSNNPVFNYSGNKITFNTTVQMTIDCRIRVDALDPITNFLFGGVNGTYDVSIDVQNMQALGDITFFSVAGDYSNLQFKLAPTVGSVVVRDRGAVTPTSVKNGIKEVIKTSFSVKIEENVVQKYDNFELSNCRTDGEFTCEYDSLPSSSPAEVHAVARGTDNKLYTAMRRDGVWSSYSELCCTTTGPLQINFSSDPSIAVSSAGTVELAALTSMGAEIFYAQYQNGWKDLHFVIAPQGTRFLGKPAIIATAPGQIEIFVMRADNKVVHVRRLNGVWTAPVVVNLPGSSGTIPNVTFLTYRDPVAVRSGNKIFLTAVSSNNRLYSIVYDLETALWGQASQISTTETVNFAPALASSGDGRIDLVYVGQSGNLYHRPLYVNSANIASTGSTTGFSFSAENNIPANVTSTPALVASGYRQLDLVARGTDNRLYYNHFTGTHSPTGWIEGLNVVQGWSGWGGLNGNFYGTQLLSNENTEEFAVDATKSGKLEMVARIRANTISTAYTLHYNDFDSSGFGVQPWKTVAWRGYQKLGDRQFNGRPAVAALDGNFALAFVGNGRNLYDSQRGSDFAPLTGFQVLSTPAPVDPVSVSSGKGLVDVIAVGTDQKLYHIRYINDRIVQTAALPSQTNLNFQSRPAVVGYGDGQLDVVGITTAGAIYHWRYITGIWQAPRVINGVATSPVLVNTGSGQLEFFAIGGDNKLYRWRFLGGAWGNYLQLPSAFTINTAKFGQGSATTAGDGTVDLAVVTNQAGVLVYHRFVEPRDDTVSLPNLPAQTFRSIGSGANQPFIAAFNKTEKFVIANDSISSDLKYFSLNNSTTWQAGMLYGGNLGLLIGGTAYLPSGAVAVASDVSGKIYYHDLLRAIGPRSNFIPVPGQSSQFWLSQPRYRPTIASFAGQ